MKIKALATLCKKSKAIIIYDNKQDDIQWLSDGGAIYPLLKMPFMTENNIFALFDIPESKENKYYCKQMETSEVLNFNNDDDVENELKEERVLFTRDGRTLKPFQTSKGLIFIDAEHLKPIADEFEVKYYERFSKIKKDVYIAVKNGMEVIALIMPFNCIDDNFVQQMDDLTRMSKVALQSKKLPEEGVNAQ